MELAAGPQAAVRLASMDLLPHTPSIVFRLSNTSLSGHDCHLSPSVPLLFYHPFPRFPSPPAPSLQFIIPLLYPARLAIPSLAAVLELLISG